MSYQIHQGDALTVLRTLPTNSFDGCLTDPPYGLSFMGKAWDRGVPGVALWREVLRALKPGAMLLAFGGTRTHHRLMCAIEDAGFEIRDCCMWLYGSGFPKSLDISKALDKAAGVESEVVGVRQYADGTTGHFADAGVYGAVNGGTLKYVTAPATEAARAWDGYGTALKPAWEPIIVAMKPCEGTFAENALKWGVAGLAIDAGRIGTSKDIPASASGVAGLYKNGHKKLDERSGMDANIGRWPANLLLDEESALQLDRQIGPLKSGAWDGNRNTPKTQSVFGEYGSRSETGTVGDSGGASRFFYTSKASGAERSANLQGKNDHPTVKPVDLNRYLAKLILPPERDTPRRLVVPFCGSGSEILGAMSAGWDEIVGIEISEEYVALSRARVEESAPLFLRDTTEASA